MQIFGFLGNILGYALWAAFYVFQNFGLAIIAFTIVIKLLILPFSVKQQKSMSGNARLSKKQKELREKYGNNRQLLQEEMNKLYEKEGVKPMGGCLTTIVPMLVLFGVFYAVAYPLTNTLHLNGDAVNSAVTYMSKIPGYVANSNPNYQQIALLDLFKYDQFVSQSSTLQSLFTADNIAAIDSFSDGFSLFGLDLLSVPADHGFWSVYLIFPALCLVSNIGSQFIMTKVNSSAMGQQQGCMKVVMYLLPLFSAYITYSVPSALGFYWFISAILSLIQSIVLAKICSPVKLTANSEARHAALLFENEAKVPYVYAPSESASAGNANAKKKKKK